MKKTNKWPYLFIISPLIQMHLLAFVLLFHSTAAYSNDKDDNAIGEAPEEDASHDLSRLFLRSSKVLLSPKEVQLSIGFNYDTDETQPNFRKNRHRSVSIPLDASYGLTERLELFTSLPFNYKEDELISAESVSKESNSGIGDLSLGLSYSLKSESYSSPSITASLNITTPTGETTNIEDLNHLSTGAGFWGISTDLNLSKSIDPAVVFMSVGFQHTFDDEQFGARIQPGNAFNYGFGAGFSVNNLVAFSGRMSGSYQRENKIDDIRVLGTSSEPISFIGSMSYRLSNDTRLETTLDLGVSGDANDVGMGFSYIWNL
jgi:hypothetical protein